MRKVGLLIVLLLCINETVYGQWVQLPFPTTDNLRSVAFVNADTGFVVATNKVYRTINGGNSWEAVISAPSPHQLYDICVPKFSKKTVYAVGGLLNFNFSGFQDVRNIVLKSTDCGASWETTINANGIGASQLEYCYFLNDSIGFVMGSCGPYISNNGFKKTTNGGQSWLAMNGVAAFIYGGGKIDFISDSIGFSGNTHKSTNQGNSWFYVGYIEGVKISFVNDYRGYITASGVKTTSDGGTTWLSTADSGISRNNEDLSDILFVDSTTGYVISTNSIFKNQNGLNWKKQFVPTSVNLIKFTSINKDTLYIVGNTGTLLKTTNGGILSSVAAQNNRSEKFVLEQNYPNPFNPSTVIKFSLPKSSQTSLIIYDMLGRQVAELVNERRAAGSYDVKFDATRLSSGVYFYRLVTSSFSQTRKMILIK